MENVERVEKIDGKYHIFLNDSNLPRLKLSRAYQEIARDKKKFEGESKEFISNKLNSANWMIQGLVAPGIAASIPLPR